MRPLVFVLVLLINSFVFSQTSINACLNQISGKVINKKENLIIPNAIIHIDDNNGNVITTHADNNGNFSIDLPCDDGRYIISTTVENYTKSTKLIFTSLTTNKKHMLILDVYPIKEFVEVNGKKRIIVDSVDFYPNDISINPEAEIQLKRVFDVLNKYLNMKIEIAFHSDSRGDERFLLDLTQQRAEACASYLIDKGIEDSRVIAKGHGATKLLNECEKGVRCSEEKHLMNRRSEFVVLK